MAITAILRYVRISERKVRPLCNELRGKNVQQAVNFLTYCPRRAARPLLKLVKSAIANADRKGGVDVDQLFIKTLMCDHGPMSKRWMARARGMTTPILKRTSHVTLVLDER